MMQQPNPQVIAQCADRAVQDLKSLEATLTVFKNDLAQFYAAIGEPGIAQFILSPVAPQVGQMSTAGQGSLGGFDQSQLQNPSLSQLNPQSQQLQNPWLAQQISPQPQGQQAPPFYPFLEQGPLMPGTITGRPGMQGGQQQGGQQQNGQQQGHQGQQQGHQGGMQSYHEGGQQGQHTQVQRGQARPY